MYLKWNQEMKSTYHFELTFSPFTEDTKGYYYLKGNLYVTMAETYSRNQRIQQNPISWFHL